MIEIRIPKEITEYKEKFLFGLTVRQFVSAVAALAVCIPVFIYGKEFLGGDITGWIIILIAIPIFAFGFFKYDGMYFEKFLVMIYRQKWAEPQKRTYEELPVFWECREEIIEDRLAHQLAEIKRNKKLSRRRKDGAKH
ncbi:MAG: PrgI family protein [Ruminococcaceae bacterium]|nr:PrgI family protein [Oscillospiraceae bacterium]